MCVENIVVLADSVVYKELSNRIGYSKSFVAGLVFDRALMDLKFYNLSKKYQVPLDFVRPNYSSWNTFSKWPNEFIEGGFKLYLNRPESI